MQFACHVGAQLIGAQQPAPAPVTADATVSVQPTVTDNGGSMEPATSSAGDPAVSDAEEPADTGSSAAPVRRKRRTKAEMEAARAAVDTMSDKDVEWVGNSRAEATRAHAAVNDEDIEAAAPFDPISAVQAIQSQLQTHEDIARTVHADGSVTTTSVGLPPDAAPEEVTTPLFLAQADTLQGRALMILGTEPGRIESLPHLRECQAFIQKFGMPKYNESFKEGLSANITTYSPEQRALHLAILESLSE